MSEERCARPNRRRVVRHAAAPVAAVLVAVAVGAGAACARTTAGGGERAGERDATVGRGSPNPATSEGRGEGTEPGGGEAVEAARRDAVLRRDPPSAPGAMAPNLSPARGGGAWLSWLEPHEGGHRLRVARFADDRWSEPVTVAAGDRFFANWADVPSVAEDGDGMLLAHWLEMTGEGTYDYGIELARSDDGGATWRRLGPLHADGVPAEHGFVTLLGDPGGGFEAFWLDGREMPGGGAMTLRTARVGPEGSEGERLLDDRVCDCCPTAAAWTADGLLLAYRDRTADEVRDHLVRVRRGGRWGEARPIAGEGWRIAACPVNGPAVAAAGGREAVAWFTAADGRPRVEAAWSRPGGGFGPPAVVDDGRPLGRVGAAILSDGSAVVSWLSADGGVRLRRLRPDGSLGEPQLLARTSTARASGVPRIVRVRDGVLAAWVEVPPETEKGEAPGTRLRAATAPSAALR